MLVIKWFVPIDSQFIDGKHKNICSTEELKLYMFESTQIDHFYIGEDELSF